MNNYIPDQNRFKLSGPPKWWLQQLWDFDSSLVVVPSRQGFYYRLCQRRKLNLTEKMVNDMLFKESDTHMLASYSLVPVTTILATANWSNPFLFEELKNRAPWRLGGAEKVNKMLDERDALQQAQLRAATEDNLVERARDGWKAYQYRTGQRTFIDATKDGRKPERIRAQADGRPASSSAPQRHAGAVEIGPSRVIVPAQ